MNRRIDLIRHAQTTANIDPHRIGGQDLHVQLSEEGEQQALILGERYPLHDTTHLLSSTADRAIRTAQIAFPAAGLTTDTRFLELSQGENEGRLRAEVFTPDYIATANREGWHHRGAPSAETWDEVAERMRDGIDDWAERADGDPLVVISHVTAIRALTGRIKGLSQEDALFKQKVRNTHVTRLEDAGRGWQVTFMDLPPAEAAKYIR